MRSHFLKHLKRQRRQHNTGDDGFLATNRSGYSLCPGWHDGTCSDSRSKGWCRRVPGKAHQCATCLSQEHGAQVCQRPAAQAPRSVGTWTGYVRSREKGKSGGKGGLQKRLVLFARFPASSASTTSTACVRLTLLSRRLRPVVAQSRRDQDCVAGWRGEPRSWSILRPRLWMVWTGVYRQLSTTDSRSRKGDSAYKFARGHYTNRQGDRSPWGPK